jgi:hypothetical protein
MGTKSYFTDIEAVIQGELDAAQTSITVAVAWLTAPTLFNALVRAARRGVLVRIALIDDDTNRNSRLPMERLITANGQCYWIAKTIGLFHNKFCIIDSNIVITGSYNWTIGASRHNDENIVVIDGDSKMVAGYIQAFESLLKKYGHTSADTHLKPLEVTPKPPSITSAKLTRQAKIKNELKVIRPERYQKITQSLGRLSVGRWLLIGTIVGIVWLSSESGNKISAIVLTTKQSLVNTVFTPTVEVQPSPDKLVKKIQQQLNRLGYDVGNPNGILDARTSTAIMTFQSTHKMVTDSHASKSLLATLVKARSHAQETPEIVSNPKCTLKRGMSDDDYRACGINPPK